MSRSCNSWKIGGLSPFLLDQSIQRRPCLSVVVGDRRDHNRDVVAHRPLPPNDQFTHSRRKKAFATNRASEFPVTLATTRAARCWVHRMVRGSFLFHSEIRSGMSENNF